MSHQLKYFGQSWLMEASDWPEREQRKLCREKKNASDRERFSGLIHGNMACVSWCSQATQLWRRCCVKKLLSQSAGEKPRATLSPFSSMPYWSASKSQIWSKREKKKLPFSPDFKIHVPYPRSDRIPGKSVRYYLIYFYPNLCVCVCVFGGGGEGANKIFLEYTV